MKSEWCAAHVAGLLGMKNKTGETIVCRQSPSCPRRHFSDLKQVSRAEVLKTLGYIKGFIGTEGCVMVKKARAGTFQGE